MSLWISIKHCPSFHCASSVVNGNQLKMKYTLHSIARIRDSQPLGQERRIQFSATSCCDNKANEATIIKEISWHHSVKTFGFGSWACCVMQVICGAFALYVVRLGNLMFILAIRLPFCSSFFSFSTSRCRWFYFSFFFLSSLDSFTVGLSLRVWAPLSQCFNFFITFSCASLF